MIFTIKSVRKLIINTAIVFTFIFPNIANSTILSINDSHYGANSLTLDTATQLQWLDISLTANRSYNDIITQLGIGGEFEGFRYANQSEVEGFWNNAGIFDYSNAYITENYDPIKSLIPLLGATASSSISSFTIGIYDGLTLGGYQRTASLQFRDDTSMGKANLTFNGVTQSYLSSSHGSYLVRNASVVSEPSTLILLSLGLLAFYAQSKRKVGISTRLQNIA